jgi:hypothetical protein
MIDSIKFDRESHEATLASLDQLVKLLEEFVAITIEEYRYWCQPND